MSVNLALGQPPGAAAQIGDGEKQLATNAKEMADAARKGYDAFRDAFRNGTVVFGDVHTWSLRLMWAEVAISRDKHEEILARESHLKRMKEWLERLRIAELAHLTDKTEASYYVLEAERLVLEAKLSALKTQGASRQGAPGGMAGGGGRPR
jgi:hypothetical protein